MAHVRQEYMDAAQMCSKAGASDDIGDLAQHGLRSATRVCMPSCMCDTGRELEALREALGGAMETVRLARVQLEERVARFPQRVDDLIDEERAIAREALVCVPGAENSAWLTNKIRSSTCQSIDAP